MPAPLPIRLAAGIAATTVEEAFRLPYRLRRLPGQVAGSAFTSAAGTAMRARQNVTDLVARGDMVLEELSTPVEEQPAWATFDEDGNPDTAAARSAAAASAAAAGAAGELHTPAQVAEEVGYADMDAEDLEDLIPMLDAAQLSALSRHERDLGDRPAFRTLLDNALRG
ncbi:hypothetical protein FOB82_01795 [Corynebacterium xerosis]|uniref:Lipid droplet-associated protein n=1 Tax=Corynebacterium xerosis TaxID=1725 RepID=A0A6B8TD84_9CORY|nr:hypothetical protein [Corynebacterium xerosis]QGS33868.1 hypothetical protein FOB82_01795 [Corynebacterium xerosis]